MTRFVIVLPAALLFTAACDSKPEAKPAAAADAKSEADAKPVKNKYTEEREKKAAAAKKAEEDKKAKIAEITVIPEGTKIPKKASAACEQVVEAQRNFMKKFHPDIEEAALTTQLGLVGKQCNEMKNIKVAMCQKFALDATTDDLQKSINEYLPVCMEKYPEG